MSLEIFMKANLSTARLKDKEEWYNKMACMKVIGRMVCDQATEPSDIQMGIVIMACGWKIRKMVMEYYGMQMETSIKENYRMISSMELAY